MSIGNIKYAIEWTFKDYEYYKTFISSVLWDSKEQAIRHAEENKGSGELYKIVRLKVEGYQE